VEIRPVAAARAVESNDASDVRKKLNAWERKQLKETDQQKRSEQRLGDRRGGGRQWGDIMERGNRRGGRDNRRERYDDRDRNDNQNRREDDQENQKSSRSSESQKPKIQDIEIGAQDLENASSKRKSSEGSDVDHSFDDEPKKGSTDTAEPDKE